MKPKQETSHYSETACTATIHEQQQEEVEEVEWMCSNLGQQQQQQQHEWSAV